MWYQQKIIKKPEDLKYQNWSRDSIIELVQFYNFTLSCKGIKMGRIPKLEKLKALTKPECEIEEDEGEDEDCFIIDKDTPGNLIPSRTMKRV